MSEVPVMPSSSPSLFQTWVKALTKPKEETFAEIAASPNAKAMTGYLWVFLTSIVASFFTLIVQGSTLRNTLSQAGVGTDQFGGGLAPVGLTLICVTPIAAVVGTFLFAVGVALVQWIARMFGGTGTNDQLAYTMAAIWAPYSLVSAVLALLSAIPYAGFCFGIIALLALVYVLVLSVMAVKAVNKFGWGPAAASLLIPGLVIFLICCCIAAVVISVSGLAIGNVLSSINQSLIP
jgi:Yip1 domain